MRFTLTGEISHRYVWVDTHFTHSKPMGFIPAVWFGLVSYPGRAWGCTVMLESGAIYRNLPPHALAFREGPEVPWSVKDAQTWDCYGWDFTVLEYSYLSGLDLLAKLPGRDIEGEYLFSVAPVGDAFSREPEQAKEFTFSALGNGRLTIQPTNHVVFMEKSFTTGQMEFPEGLARQKKIWTCE